MTPITPEIRRIWATTPLAMIGGVPQRELDSTTIMHERLQGRPSEIYVLCNAGYQRWQLIDVIFGANERNAMTKKGKRVRVKKGKVKPPAVVTVSPHGT